MGDRQTATTISNYCSLRNMKIGRVQHFTSLDYFVHAMACDMDHFFISCFSFLLPRTRCCFQGDLFCYKLNINQGNLCRNVTLNFNLNKLDVNKFARK